MSWDIVKNKLQETSWKDIYNEHYGIEESKSPEVYGNPHHNAVPVTVEEGDEIIKFTSIRGCALYLETSSETIRNYHNKPFLLFGRWKITICY